MNKETTVKQLTFDYGNKQITGTKISYNNMIDSISAEIVKQVKEQGATVSDLTKSQVASFVRVVLVARGLVTVDVSETEGEKIVTEAVSVELTKGYALITTDLVANCVWVNLNRHFKEVVHPEGYFTNRWQAGVVEDKQSKKVSTVAARAIADVISSDVELRGKPRKTGSKTVTYVYDFKRGVKIAVKGEFHSKHDERTIKRYARTARTVKIKMNQK